MNKIAITPIFQKLFLNIYESGNKPFIDSFKFICPESQLISNFEEIEKIMKLKDIKIIEFLYNNKIRIHKILYDTELIISLKSTYFQKFSDYFYIDLLIMENPNIINYSFSIDVIRNLNSFLENEDLNIRKIIVSKISIDFIRNYMSNDDFNLDYQKELGNF